MSAPNGIAPQLPAHLGRSAPSRGPMAGWRNIGCRETPNGWPTDDKKTRHAAEIEALAEAGATGSISDLPTGVHCCDKRLDRCTKVRCRTMVCAMVAGGPTRHSKERMGGMCRSISFRQAARLADEKEISRLLKTWHGLRNDRRRRKESAKPREASQTKAGTTGPI